MGKVKMYLVVGLCAMFFVSLICGSVLSEEEKTVVITGTINEEFQLVDNNGEVYEINDYEKGSELIENIDIGMKVKVTGTIEEDEGIKYITVISYKIIS